MKNTLSELPDAELMARVQQQSDEEAFAVLIGRHRTVAFVLAARIAGHENADDVLQLAFLMGWRSRVTYRRDRGAPRTWLLAIVRNRAIDTLRGVKSAHRVERASEMAVGDQRVHEANSQLDVSLVEREDASAIRAALARLPAEQRDALELSYFVGLTHMQIAERLALPVGTIKGRVRLGLMKLQREVVR